MTAEPELIAVSKPDWKVTMNANCELFGNLHKTRVILEGWRIECNERRLHRGAWLLNRGEYAYSRSNCFARACAPKTVH